MCNWSRQAWPQGFSVLFLWTPTCHHPSPHPAVARTCLTLAAQLWAAWAWALSVSSLSVLLSTLTLPSPICLMNRRNYTQDRNKKNNKTKEKQQQCDSMNRYCERLRRIVSYEGGVSIALATWQHHSRKNRKEWTNQESDHKERREGERSFEKMNVMAENGVRGKHKVSVHLCVLQLWIVDLWNKLIGRLPQLLPWLILLYPVGMTTDRQWTSQIDEQHGEKRKLSFIRNTWEAANLFEWVTHRLHFSASFPVLYSIHFQI